MGQLPGFHRRYWEADGRQNMSEKGGDREKIKSGGKGYREEYRNTQMVSLIWAEWLSRGFAFIVITEITFDCGLKARKNGLKQKSLEKVIPEGAYASQKLDVVPFLLKHHSSLPFFRWWLS